MVFSIFIITEKNGVSTNEVVDLYKHIIDKCENLKLIGLMTIGQYGYDCSLGPNPDFLVIINYFKCAHNIILFLYLNQFFRP
jgi:hypothetical protein